ncbi:hypothetical protein HanPI659440_Chr03g0127121 [Helianthus annuus]|nr:hypothetical protein HanPI659440_Chr03g0127121 [Helianthus annuus]
MNLIYIIVATRVSNVLLPQLRTNLFSIRSWEIAEPSNVSIDTTMGTSRILTKHARKYNTDASLDSSPCWFRPLKSHTKHTLKLSLCEICGMQNEETCCID